MQLLRLDSLSDLCGCEFLAMAEHLNPSGTGKDRIALEKIRAAEPWQRCHWLPRGGPRRRRDSAWANQRRRKSEGARRGRGRISERVEGGTSKGPPREPCRRPARVLQRRSKRLELDT
ncbi:hypothetical protein M885DRAFT_281352 [Pelagophyceae sp. CCMP2097]|nr:hypothetical protein M885DRAFT_281352 [Pelagophyceae sp. CCMP2097]